MSYLRTIVPLPLLQSLSIADEKCFSSIHNEDKDGRHSMVAIKEYPPYPEPYCIDGIPISHDGPSNKQNPDSLSKIYSVLIKMEKKLKDSPSEYELTQQSKKIEDALKKYPQDCKVI